MRTKKRSIYDEGAGLYRNDFMQENRENNSLLSRIIGKQSKQIENKQKNDNAARRDTWLSEIIGVLKG